MIAPGTAVALSAGTTTWGLAAVANIAGLTVVTNSTTVADTISAGETKQTVILTGGVRTPSAALVGPVADATIRSLHFDQLFLGVHGMDPRAGFTTPNLAEAETNRSLISRAREVIVVADSSKWGDGGTGRLRAAVGRRRPDHRRRLCRRGPGGADRGGRRAHRGPHQPSTDRRPR